VLCFVSRRIDIDDVNMKLRDILKLVLAVMVCQAAGALGGLITAHQIPTWYASLIKPFFTPPSWLFGPVWVLLYALMGVAVFLILRKGWHTPGVRTAGYFFGAQLFLNALWTPLFFGLHWLLLAFVDIVLLWILIWLTYWRFLKLSRASGYLLIPYLGWVSYATALNLAFWLLNW
jgi:benzodiazapine receptor